MSLHAPRTWIFGTTDAPDWSVDRLGKHANPCDADRPVGPLETTRARLF